MSGYCSFRLCLRVIVPGLETCDKHRVYVPPVKPEREQSIKLRIRDALVAAGCMAKIHVTDNRNFKHSGLGDGTSDLICIVPPRGTFLAIEVKRPKYSPSDVTPDQRCFLAAVRKFGGVSGIATNVEEALALVDETKQSQRSDAVPSE